MIEVSMYSDTLLVPQSGGSGYRIEDISSTSRRKSDTAVSSPVHVNSFIQLLL